MLCLLASLCYFRLLRTANLLPSLTGLCSISGARVIGLPSDTRVSSQLYVGLYDDGQLSSDLCVLVKLVSIACLGEYVLVVEGTDCTSYDYSL